MADLIPGTNNVTPYVRPFSILSWIYWKFHDLCEQSGKIEPTSEEARLFRERIEVLFTWGARLADIPSIPGKQAEPPPESEGRVELTFEAWKRVQSSTSLIAALWYGPASKTVTGLGFLEPLKPGFFRTAGQGVILAEALDRVLRTNQELYNRVIDRLSPVTATADDARDFWNLWGVESVTDDERQAFRKALYSDAAIGDYARPLGKRSSTIALAKFHLSQSGNALTADDIRRGMYYSMTAGSAVYTVPEKLETARCKWIVLQVRQLQRLALETLLSWCEYRIISGVHDTSALTKDAEHAFAAENFDIDPSANLAGLLGELDAKFSSLDDFVAHGRTNELFCPFSLMAKIQSELKSMDDGMASSCLYAVLLCASFAGCFGDSDRGAISIGGTYRLSLYHVRKRFTALGNVSLRQAIQFILEAMIISQHLATAVNRFDGQNQRLRLSIEETGLVSLVGKPWVPIVTEDRLPTILRLSADSGLIHNATDGTFVL